MTALTIYSLLAIPRYKTKLLQWIHSKFDGQLKQQQELKSEGVLQMKMFMHTENWDMD